MKTRTGLAELATIRRSSSSLVTTCRGAYPLLRDRWVSGSAVTSDGLALRGTEAPSGWDCPPVGVGAQAETVMAVIMRKAAMGGRMADNMSRTPRASA
jgi:hypothetical protein